MGDGAPDDPAADDDGRGDDGSTVPSRHLSVSIDRPPAPVYAFVSDPGNLPRWASGLTDAIASVDGEWIAQSPMGQVTVEFVDENPFGVLDHYVTVPSGERIHNPMRVVPNNEGSEVVFTLFRRPGTSMDRFEEDARLVAADLDRLKYLLEREA